MPIDENSLCAPELSEFLAALKNFAPKGAYYDMDFQERMHADDLVHETYLHAVFALGVLYKEDVLNVRERWKDRFGLYVDVLDFLLIDALNQEMSRVKEALDALKNAMNKDTTH